MLKHPVIFWWLHDEDPGLHPISGLSDALMDGIPPAPSLFIFRGNSWGFAGASSQSDSSSAGGAIKSRSLTPQHARAGR